MIRALIWRWRYEHAMKVALKMLYRLQMDTSVEGRIKEWRRYKEEEDDNE